MSQNEDGGFDKLVTKENKKHVTAKIGSESVRSVAQRY